MDPKQFNWKADQQITVTNPTKDNFRFQIHSKWYEVEAGQTVKMPGYIAWLYVYKLATKMALAAGDFKHWNEENFRQRYFDKLVLGVDSVIQAITPELPPAETFEADDTVEMPAEPESSDEEEPSDPTPSGVKPMRRKKVEKAV